MYRGRDTLTPSLRLAVVWLDDCSDRSMVESMNCVSDAAGMTSDNGTGRWRGGSLQVRVLLGRTR
jgi:hypothetical protein